MRSKSSLLLATAVVAALGLGACSSRYATTPFDMTNPKTVMSGSYKAADMLAAQSLNIVSPDTPIAVATFSDVNKIESSSALGRMIAEQIGARLVQTGYNVSEIKLRNDINVQQALDSSAESGEFVLSRNRVALAGHTNARAVVTGTYALAGENVLVNARLIDVNSSRILAAHDYTMPLNSDVRRLLQADGNNTAVFGSGWAQ